MLHPYRSIRVQHVQLLCDVIAGYDQGGVISPLGLLSQDGSSWTSRTSFDSKKDHRAEPRELEAYLSLSQFQRIKTRVPFKHDSSFQKRAEAENWFNKCRHCNAADRRRRRRREMERWNARTGIISYTEDRFVSINFRYNTRVICRVPTCI